MPLIYIHISSFSSKCKNISETKALQTHPPVTEIFKLIT